MYYLILGVILALASGCNAASHAEEMEPVLPGWPVAVTIKPNVGRLSISPYIYGSNHDLGNSDLWTVRRIGGNRLTGYNWENDFSNAGSDYMHSSDT